MSRSCHVLVAIPVLLLFTAAFTFAAKEPPSRVIDPQVYRVMQYAFPYPTEPDVVKPGPLREQGTQQLGISAPSASPGTAVGVTWYEKQHNGAVGRQNETRTGNYTLAHFSWMNLPSRVIDQARAASYDNYNITLQAWGTEVAIQPNDQYAGYVNLDVTNDNRAIVGGHNREPSDGHYDPTFYFDFAEGSSFFGSVIQLPQSISDYGGTPGQEVIWPKFAYSEGPNDTVLHVFAQVSEPNAGDPQAIYYFRRVGSDANLTGTWDYPPRVVDTVFDIAQTVEATDDGKVGLSWVANIPCSAADPDTASCNSGVSPVQWNNDIYYQVSNDYGVTWQPRVNLTNNINATGAHYQPYTDIGLLWDSWGYLHVVWGAAYWDEVGDIYRRDRIFHWSQNTPYIRAAHSADWDQTTCNGGAWTLNASKMSISECNGRFYILFAQFNDGAAGIFDDCADDGNPGFPGGAANGELYVTISEDFGLTWDQARNLTNSRTPGCDSTDGTGGPCESDMWPTMARYGTDVALAPGDNVTDVVVPGGGADNGWYLDVQYINDHSAGAIVSGEGFWQQADVRWFRLACVEPVLCACPIPMPASLNGWTSYDRVFNYPFPIENLGNDPFAYTITEEEDPGELSGWLSTSGFSGVVPYGFNNIETGIVTIDPFAAGAQMAHDYLVTGRLIFNSNSPTSPDTIPIAFIITDTIVEPDIDTVRTPALALVATSAAEMGEEGAGRLNMDYVSPQDPAYLDCDSTADVYLYSGSPVIAYIDGADTVANFSLFGNGLWTEVGFYPIASWDSFEQAGCEVYKSVCVTRDTGLAIQTTLYAPNSATGDSVDFIIKSLRIYPADGLAHSNVSIGEAIDWDIPSDSGSDNGSGFDVAGKLIWQYGGEYDQDDTTECQNSDARFGGILFLQMRNNTTDLSNMAPVNAYTADNATWVYGNENGFVPGEIFTQMETKSGFSRYESANPDSVYTDLHTVMTFTNNMNFAATDTITIWMALITLRNGTQTDLVTAAAKARTWWYRLPWHNSCCTLRGDVNCDGKVTVADLTCMIDPLFRGFPWCNPECCDLHRDVNCDGKVVISDLTYLVNYLFKGGTAPCACPL